MHERPRQRAAYGRGRGWLLGGRLFRGSFLGGVGLLLIAAAGPALADVLETTWGLQLEAEVAGLGFDTLTLRTAYGELRIPRSLVASRTEGDVPISDVLAERLAGRIRGELERGRAAADIPGFLLRDGARPGELLALALAPSPPIPRGRLLDVLASTDSREAKRILLLGLFSTRGGVTGRVASILARRGGAREMALICALVHDAAPPRALEVLDAALPLLKRECRTREGYETFRSAFAPLGAKHPLLPRYLALLGTDASIRDLLRLPTEKDLGVRLRGVAAMRLVEGWTIPASAVLRAFERKGSARLEREVATTLGFVRDLRAVPRLIRWLEGPDAVLRQIAHRSLQRLTEQRIPADPVEWRHWWSSVSSLVRAIEPLTYDAEDEAVGTRKAAVERLARFNDRRALNALLLRLDDPDPEVLAIACRGLGRHREKLAAPGLISLLDRPERAVREAAHQALCAIAGRSMPPSSAVWKAWLDKQCR